MGKNVEVAPIPDVYTSNMLIIKEDSVKADTEYGDALAELIGNYSEADIGSELTFVIQGLSNNDPQALYAATTVAKAYQSFGNDLMKIPVPNHIASIQLSMANNYEKVGQSIFGLTKMLIDPMTAMRSIINYKNYSDALAMNFEMLSEILQ